MLGSAILRPLYLQSVLGPRLRGGRGRAQAYGCGREPQRPAGRGPAGRRRRGDAAPAGIRLTIFCSLPSTYHPLPTSPFTACGAVLLPSKTQSSEATTASHGLSRSVNAVRCGPGCTGHARRRRRRRQCEWRVGARRCRRLLRRPVRASAAFGPCTGVLREPVCCPCVSPQRPRTSARVLSRRRITLERVLVAICPAGNAEHWISHTRSPD